MTIWKTRLTWMLAALACAAALGFAPAGSESAAPAYLEPPPGPADAGVALQAPPGGDSGRPATDKPFAQPAFPPDYGISSGRFYLQTAQAVGTGYPVTNEEGIPFWTFFSGRGGVDRFGYPVSGRFMFKGFVTQAFQKSVLQWDHVNGWVNFFNVLDELGDSGFDGFLEVQRQTPKRQEFPGELDLPFEGRKQLRLKLLERDAKIAATYFGNPHWQEQYGLPTGFAESELVAAIRTQRAVFLHWKVNGDWGPAGTVTIANAGDLAKETGFLPAGAVKPGPAPLPGNTAAPIVVAADAAAEPQLRDVQQAINLAYDLVWRRHAAWRTGPIKVVIYGEREAFVEASYDPAFRRSKELLRNVLGLHLLDPSARNSELRLNLAAIKATGGDLADSITHEFVHSVQSEILGRSGGSDWLIEGMAEATSLRAGNSPSRKRIFDLTFAAALNAGDLPSLIRLGTSQDWEAYGGSETQRRWLAQTASFQAVNFLMDAFGDQVGFEIMRRMRSSGAGLEQALLGLTGMSVQQLDAAYRNAGAAAQASEQALPLAA